MEDRECNQCNEEGTAPIIETANGVRGVLIYTADGEYAFRVYGEGGTFKDYSLRHYDLSVTIEDMDAALYEYPDGRAFLDHSPETLNGE